MPGAANADADNEDIETFAARRQRLKMRRQKARRSSRWVALVLRNEMVRYLPQTASLFAAIGLPVNLRDSNFENVRISKEGQDGVNVFIIEGTIVSTARKPIEVPRLLCGA